MLAEITRDMLVNTNDICSLKVRISDIKTWDIVLETKDGKTRILKSYPDINEARNAFDEIKCSLKAAGCLIDVCPD